MNRIFTIGFTILLLGGMARAQDQLVLKKAQQIRDQNNIQQGITPAPAATAPAPVQPAAPTGPQSIAPAQQQLIERLESDFAVVKTGTPAPPEQKQAMINEMTSLAKGAVKPTKPELTKLAANLATALAEKPFAAKDTALLARDVNIVENCSSLTSARAQTFVAEAQTTLRKNGVSDANIQAVGADLKAIVTEIQNGKSKLYQ